MFGGGGEMLAPSVDRREMTRYSDFLKLNGEQKGLVQELFEGFQQQFRTEAEVAREKMDGMRERAREQRDPAAFREMRTVMQSFMQKRTALEKQFFEDVRSTLTPEQDALWPRFERLRRREETLRRGRMSGERVDLVALVENAKLPPETLAQLTPMLEQYEAELDRELIQRNKVYEDSMNRLGDGRGDGNLEQMGEQLQKMLDEARTASVRVRDVNRRYARQVEAALSEDRRATFAKSVREASYPDIWRKTQTTRQFEAAMGFADLTADQKAAIETIRARYDRDAAAANERMEVAQTDMEEKISVQQMFRRGRGGQGEENSPLNDVRRERRDLERTTGEALKKILTPEQQARLPQPERQDGPGGGGGGAVRRRGGDGA